MVRNWTWRLLFFLLGSGNLFAQQLTPEVISTSGGFFSGSAGMLSYTVGEMAAIETYTSVSSILTQGFQQDWDFSTGISESSGDNFSFFVFPNPSDGRFQLGVEGDAHFHAEISISDILGQPLLTQTFDHHGGTWREFFDLASVPSGVYTIQIVAKAQNGQPEGHFTHRIQVIR